MCLKTAADCADYVNQKFGYQRQDYGNTEAQKSLNQFQFAVVYPTNWRTYDPEPGKYPAFIRYGGYVPEPVEYYQKGYAGIYPLKEQPIVDPPQPYVLDRNS